jgi:ParB-like chromosome segregation protein Spo0J
MKEKRDYKIAKAKTVHPSPALPPRIHQTELADSVNTVVVQQPFIVRPHPSIEGHFEVIDGRARYAGGRLEVLDRARSHNVRG